MKVLSQTLKVLRLLMFLCFFYQFYDLTNDYLKYNHLIQMDVKTTESSDFSITVCLYHDNRAFISDCHLDYNNMKGEKQRKHCLLFKTYIRFKNNSICCTFNSRKSENVSRQNYFHVKISKNMS